LTALLVRGHGPTVWGASLQEAYNRFETLEFILRYLSHTRRS
jgi:methylthioribulose-1-phosphate dehydratase